MTDRALVTGAGGHLGRRLVPLLRRRGWRVRALLRSERAVNADEVAVGDLGDAEALARAVAGTNAVVHAAAVTHARSRRAYERANVTGTRVLVEAAADAGVGRFVLVSTRAVSPDGGWYAASKLRAEEVVRASGIPYCVVRLPEVYGAGSEEGVDRVVDAVRAGRRVPVVGAGTDELCPVHVDDALAALAAALDSPAATGRTYTLAGECLSYREIIDRCAAAFGVDAHPVSVPIQLVAVGGLAARLLPLPLYPDQLERLRAPKPGPSADAQADLGFRPRPLDAGLRDLAVGGGD